MSPLPACKGKLTNRDFIALAPRLLSLESRPSGDWGPSSGSVLLLSLRPKQRCLGSSQRSHPGEAALSSQPQTRSRQPCKVQCLCYVAEVVSSSL